MGGVAVDDFFVSKSVENRMLRMKGLVENSSASSLEEYTLLTIDLPNDEIITVHSIRRLALIK